MKNIFKTILLGLCMTAAVTVSAAAANYTHCADRLHEMGLVQGTTSGYELDRTPTRAEAATMLVRLLGREAEAKTLPYSAPFTDVDDWQKPYVQYLYDNKLTNGATETAFSPEDTCDAQMYSAFVLRTLGYDDAKGGDFTYANAMEKATQVGIAGMKQYTAESKFLRDDMVAMSYTALSIPPKEKADKNLLSQLVEEGAVAQNKAQGTLDLFDTYGAYLSEVQSSDTAGKIDMDGKIDFSLESGGIELIKGQIGVRAKTDINSKDLTKSKMSIANKFDFDVMDSSQTDGEIIYSEWKKDAQYYYTDGMYYIQADGNKYKMPLDLSSLQEIMAEMPSQSLPVSAVESITHAGERYTIAYQPKAMEGILTYYLADPSFGHEDMKIEVTKVSSVIENGKLSEMDFGMVMSDSASDIHTKTDFAGKILADGDAVTVELPNDLDTYTDIIGYSNEIG